MFTSTITKRILAAGLALLAPAALAAELIQSSPFVSSSAPPAPVLATAGPIEFRGAFQMGDAMYFSIYDTAKKHATFVKMGDSSMPFVVRSYRANSDQIVVDYQGISQTLPLRRGKIQTTGSPLPLPPPPSAPGAAGAVAAGSPAATPMPNLPAGASIEEWAAEVQRRRELRTPANGGPETVVPTATPAQPPRG